MSGLKPLALALSLVLAADMLWSPSLTDSLTKPAEPQWLPAPALFQNGSEAARLYASSSRPAALLQRRLAAGYLLDHLNPPRQHTAEALSLAPLLESGKPTATAWDYLQHSMRYRSGSRTGWLGPYQARLEGLRYAQLVEAGKRRENLLRANDYTAFQRSWSSPPWTDNPIRLAITLQPGPAPGAEDLLPYSMWWEILADQSNYQALQAALQLAQGRQPGMPHQWQNDGCVCFHPGPDGLDTRGSLVTAISPLQPQPPSSPTEGDWVYRFR